MHTRQAHARVAVLTRHHGPDAEITRDAKLELEQAKLNERIQKLVAEAPPLSPEQHARLRAILLAPERLPRRPLPSAGGAGA